VNIETFNAEHPAFHDARFARRVLQVKKPIPVVSNLFEVVYGPCGHLPLMFSDTPPRVGDLLFCPDCYKAGLV
jgi:hypothetical protein